MKLSEYLDQERGRQAKLAREIGAHPPDLSRWADGSRAVPFPYGPKIEDKTGGLVTRKDLFPDDWGDLWPELKDALPYTETTQDPPCQTKP